MNSKILAKAALFLFAWLLMTILCHLVLNNLTFGYDFSYYWHAGNSFIRDGISPYSDQVAERILLSISNGTGISDEPNLYFAYAIYALVIPGPLFILPLGWAYTGWLVFNILVVISFIPFLFPHLPKWLGLTTFLFYEVWFTSIIGNYGGLVFIILLVSFIVLIDQDNENPIFEIICGAALAWATAKPQMVIVLIALLFLICLKYKRYWMMYGFFGTLSILVLMSFLLVPSWLQEWVEIIIRYSQVAHKDASFLGNHLSLLVNQDIAVVITAILFLSALILLIALTYSWFKGKTSLLLLIAFYALVQVVFAPTATAPNRVVLIIPIFLFVISQPNLLSTKLLWGTSIILSNLLFILGVMQTLPRADDKFTPLLFILFLVYLLVFHKDTKQQPLTLPSTI